jgi:hypothetical protein
MVDFRSRIHASRHDDNYHPDPFPVHVLKRVERPTTQIRDEEVRRVSELDGGFQRANRGEFGPFIQKEYHRFMEKYPLSHAQLEMSRHLHSVVEGPVRAEQAPLTDDPAANARHIKETAYFLRADMVGICNLPSYVVFTHSRWDGNPIELRHRYAIGILIDQD